MQVLESREIGRAMQKAEGNKSRAAEMLGLSRFALQRKLEKYGMDPDAPSGAATGPGAAAAGDDDA